MLFLKMLLLSQMSKSGRSESKTNSNRILMANTETLYCSIINFVMSCMRVCRKQALSRVKYYYYTTISKIQQATILTV